MIDEGDPHLKSLGLLEKLIEEADLDRAAVLDPVPLSMSTGLAVGVVRAGLTRRPMTQTNFQQQVAQRLAFLRETRLRADGGQYTQAEIADGSDVTPQWVGELLKGRKVPSLELASRIEDLFKVPRGFLTATPSQALNRALEEKLANEQARQLTGLRELKERFQLRSVAFRGAPETLAAMQDLLNLIVNEQPRST
ncbi:helix-turn-helix transcriptional regulator [Streptomyces sp. ISL-43]|uniref:helix-turn-helix transcriptional regulator n=1 Tax=Streptomyces sp. ISL-43 TaxID=2819183 RepID=UPI001BEADEA6|nr:helix-turn-helix transcriptional regulator [Streptomyces sp. ISL-43]MBT2449516.1 helix-turn-helix transcriptional regulator [Streptomyces sp. ISL-43]